MGNADRAYREFCDLRDTKFPDAGSGVSVAIFRVATETAAATMGLPLTCFLMAHLLSVTMGISLDDEDSTYADTLEKIMKLSGEELSDVDEDDLWAEFLSSSGEIKH